MTTEQLDLRDGFRSATRDGFIARLHEEAPLYKDPDGFWIASRFEDIRAILKDHKRFSSKAMGGNVMGNLSRDRDRERSEAERAANPMAMSIPLLTDDPPRHSVLRGLLAKAFTPAAIDAMRPDVEQLARDLVAEIPSGQEVDIVEKLTTPLPVAVIASMMGVPSERNADFKRWSNATMGLQSGGAIEADRIRSLMELSTYFSELSAKRRESPGNDLVSAMTRVEETNETLTDAQVVGFCVLLMIAGNETTTNLLGNLLYRLADRPEVWAALREDRDLIESAIEESLRVDSPAQLIVRKATEDVTINDQTIKEGDSVLVYLASANRDPAKWNDPSNFDIARERDRHFAFGHGVHNCIGAPLARMEARAAMHALVDRFETVTRGSERGRRLPGGMLYGFMSLPLVFND